MLLCYKTGDICMRKKKKKHIRIKKSWITDVPIGVCIYFIMIGIALGNVFVIGTWHWGKPIERDEAICVSCTFKSFDFHYGRYGGVSEVSIEFTDHDTLYIDGAVFSADMEESLEKLTDGEVVDMLIHPNSEYVWEMKVGSDIILSFDDAKNGMVLENIAFSVVLGTFCYFCAVLGIVSLLVRYVEYRRRINNIK